MAIRSWADLAVIWRISLAMVGIVVTNLAPSWRPLPEPKVLSSEMTWASGGRECVAKGAHRKPS